MNIKEYISPVSPGSLALSMSGLLTGIMLAAADFSLNWWVASGLVITILCLQAFKTVIPGVLAAIATVWVSYGTIISMEALLTLLLGYFVYRLVMNHSPEDGLFRNGIVVTLTSFIVYGIVPVYGAYFVCTHSFGSSMLVLPSLSAGAMCLAIVNAAHVSETRTKAFHTFWIIAGFAAMVVYSCMRIFDPWHFLYLLTAPAFIWLLYRLWSGKEKPACHETCLAATVLVFVLLSGIGFLVYLFQ